MKDPEVILYFGGKLWVKVPNGIKWGQLKRTVRRQLWGRFFIRCLLVFNGFFTNL